MNWTDPIIVNGKTYQFESIEEDPLYFIMKLGNYELYRDINCDSPLERWSLRHLYQKTISEVSSMEWFDHGNVYHGKEITSPEFLSSLLEHILTLVY
jgi:hypothetical protein